MRIHRLDPSLVNKIAAGEVIERPASVVKELVENAIDAGALRIEIALEGGGSDLIRVTDDGCGIGRDDLPLAIASHATSKLNSADDLFNIRTLGFRGEALASIASVSHLRIVSRATDQLEGYEIQSNHDPRQETIGTPDSRDAGLAAVDLPRLNPPRALAAPPGTSIEVRNLFFNVPARRKFLKQPQTECSHVTEQIARLSLAHPNIAFTLTHHGRSLRNLPATVDRRTRIADFYGSELADCLLPVRSQERELLVEGLIAPPAQSRASTKWQYLFLNGRYITDRRIAFAVREAFRGLVEHDRFPVVFLFLIADPRDFDVNVHPTKIEVRWKDAGLVQSQVLAVLRETLLSHDLTPAMSMNRARGGWNSGDSATRLGRVDNVPGRAFGDQQGARQALADYLKRVDPTQSRLTFSPPPFRTDSMRPSIAGTLRTPPMDGSRTHDAVHGSMPPFGPTSNEGTRSTPGEPTQTLPNESDRKDSPAPFVDTAAPATTATDMPAQPPTGLPAGIGAPGPGGVMQIHNTYLVAQTQDGVIIVDQHALHERILYERFRERILQGPLESQRLLIPEPIAASPTRSATIEQHASLLNRLGIVVEPFGPSALAVQAFPTLLQGVEISNFVSDLLDKLLETDGTASEETAIHTALDMMACKAAVKAGDPLTQEEMFALLEMRHLTERSSNCPHGRPTTLELTTRDLEKQFKRI